MSTIHVSTAAKELKLSIHTIEQFVERRTLSGIRLAHNGTLMIKNDGKYISLKLRLDAVRRPSVAPPVGSFL